MVLGVGCSGWAREAPLIFRGLGGDCFETFPNGSPSLGERLGSLCGGLAFKRSAVQTSYFGAVVQVPRAVVPLMQKLSASLEVRRFGVIRGAQ